MIATITRAEIIALAKEREAQVAFATRDFIREHKAEPVKSHPSFVKGWANVTFCGVETALIVGRLAKWAACFEPAELFDVHTTAEHITITAQSVKSSVKLAVRQTITKEIDAPDKAHEKERDLMGTPIVVSSDFGTCTVAKGRDAKAEKAELKKAKAKLPAMDAMATLQSQAKIAVHYQEVASGSFADALALAKCKRDALRDIRKRGVSKWNVNCELRNMGIDTQATSFSRARVNLRKWPAIKSRLSAEYIALLSAWRAEYPEPVATAPDAVAPVAPVATTPATVDPVLADTVAPLVPASEKEKTFSATLTFPTHEQAALFARDYARHTLRGHTISAKVAAVHSVEVYGVTESDRQWIDARIASEQNTPPPCPGLPVEKLDRDAVSIALYGVPYRSLPDDSAKQDEVMRIVESGETPPPAASSKEENEPVPITALEFAKSHPCDPDWVRAMGRNMIIPWRRGDAVKYGEFDGTVIRHYRNGMFEVRLPGGVVCIGFDSIPPPPSVAICKAETAIPEPATAPRHEAPPSEEKPRQRKRRTRKAHPRPSLLIRHTSRASALLWRFTLRDSIAHRASWQCAPPRGIPEPGLLSRKPSPRFPAYQSKKEPPRIHPPPIQWTARKLQPATPKP